MKIIRLETLRLGLFGLGETSYAAQSVKAYLHE
jgi:hypothetical protein